METPETTEKKKIDAYLKSIGAYVVKPATFGYGASGVPDRVFCYHGRFATIEVKREGKEPTALQEQRIKEITAAGGFACWGTAARAIPIIAAWIKPDPSYVPGKPK